LWLRVVVLLEEILEAAVVLVVSVQEHLLQ
jgi:hypothetical protein